MSDFRSALIQGKFLAKKGLEIHEFRIESGLNCGGHAFASNGYLLPVLLQEIHDKLNDFLGKDVVFMKCIVKLKYTYLQTIAFSFLSNTF